MKFFVPHADSDEEAESVRKSVRTFLESQGSPTCEDRIQRIKFHHNGKPYDLSVGDIHPDLNEPVLFIFRANHPSLYYACTPNRGVVRGEPYLIGDHEGTHAFLFDE